VSVIEGHIEGVFSTIQSKPFISLILCIPHDKRRGIYIHTRLKTTTTAPDNFAHYTRGTDVGRKLTSTKYGSLNAYIV